MNMSDNIQRGDHMLKRFEVENFKGFKDKLVFDLTARDFKFNNHLVNNGIINKAIVYGKNGVGKSSLGLALFDIIIHLTDKQRMNSKYLANYVNFDSGKSEVKFKYVFQFEDDQIDYEYSKKNPEYLLCEKLTINNEIVIDYDYFDSEKQFIKRDLIGDLNVTLEDNKLSILKYIYRNTLTNTSPTITKMMKFCENMLWYRSLSDGNTYCGFTNGGSALVEKLYESNKLEEFKTFLKENDLPYELEFVDDNGTHKLMAVYQNGQVRSSFTSIASTGTMALFLFYIWSISSFENISMLFIDEFDAFLHYESAENIILKLNAHKNFQTILTSHNTYLMQNQLTRPDCCFIMTKNKITSLCNATSKEIREAHNLEKMYINGAFNE